MGAMSYGVKVRVTAAGDAAVDSAAGSRSVQERVRNATDRANTMDLWGWIFCIVFLVFRG